MGRRHPAVQLLARNLRLLRCVELRVVDQAHEAGHQAVVRRKRKNFIGATRRRACGSHAGQEIELIVLRCCTLYVAKAHNDVTFYGHTSFCRKSHSARRASWRLAHTHTPRAPIVCPDCLVPLL